MSRRNYESESAIDGAYLADTAAENAQQENEAARERNQQVLAKKRKGAKRGKVAGWGAAALAALAVGAGVGKYTSAKQAEAGEPIDPSAGNDAGKEKSGEAPGPAPEDTIVLPQAESTEVASVTPESTADTDTTLPTPVAETAEIRVSQAGGVEAQTEEIPLQDSGNGSVTGPSAE